MARLHARITALEQYDARQRVSRQIRVVYGSDEPEQVLPGDIVLRVVYAEDPHGQADLPGSSSAKGGRAG